MTATLARDAIESRPVTLRYLLMPAAEIAASRRLGLPDLAELRRAKLRLLGILAGPAEPALEAWLRVMAAENGFPNSRPLADQLADAIYTDRCALDWFHWLA